MLNYGRLIGLREGFPVPGPALTFGFMLATLYAMAFHLLLGGGARRLGLFLLMGWFGFAVGHLAGLVFGVSLLKIGPLHFLPATVSAFLMLLVIHGLTAGKPNKRTSRTR